MRVVTPLDLRRSLGRLLDEASAGERILIERDHRPLAYLVSVEDGQRLDESEEARRARTRAALDRIRAFGERIGREYPGGPDAVTAVRLDRRRDDPIPGDPSQ
jgi:prevent-host-death family protein